MNEDEFADLEERLSRAPRAVPGQDWDDVRRRAEAVASQRRRGRRVRTVAVAAASVLAALAAAPALGIGGGIVGFFSHEGTPVDPSELSERDRRALERMAAHTGKGDVTIEKIGDDGKRAYYKLSYESGEVCLASGAKDTREGTFGTIQCPAEVPSPRRPITADIVFQSSGRAGETEVWRATGLAGEGVASVGLVADDGETYRADVRGRVYSLTEIPDRRWVAIAAFNEDADELYREPIPPSGHAVGERLGERSSISGERRLPSPTTAAGREIVQHGEAGGVVVDVHASGVVVFRLIDTEERASFLRIDPGAPVNAGCLKLAWSGGRWQTTEGVGSRTHYQPEIRVAFDGRFGAPTPPFDACTIRGTYGRIWNERIGYRNAWEIPFNAEAERFFEEQAGARKLAYFVRSRKLVEIRRALKRGEGRAPESPAIAERFDAYVVPLSSRDELPPLGAIGVWSDGGETIVASKRTEAGRRLFVTLRAGGIAGHNLEGLAFVF